ncbi:MAG: hypothetical protein IPO60_18330 [Flavobacteriales bacterium]|nr:hypothetical protein [Flavobacteriales bacterium]
MASRSTARSWCAAGNRGLSFPNPDMVEKITSAPGAQEPRYGDKLSSVLDITYKRARV